MGIFIIDSNRMVVDNLGICFAGCLGLVLLNVVILLEFSTLIYIYNAIQVRACSMLLLSRGKLYYTRQ